MRTLLGVLLVAAAASGACAGSRPIPVTSDAAPIASTVSPSGASGRSIAIGVSVDCARAATGALDAVVALAIDRLNDPTSPDRWSRACAWLQTPDAVPVDYSVTIEVAWEGTLLAYRSVSDAMPIEGLADEAVAFDAGRQVALRSGELVAVVTDSRSVGGSPTYTEASARKVADLIRSLQS